eukprot:Ihof_evm7s605 gene=Ihof_evmTU7s605
MKYIEGKNWDTLEKRLSYAHLQPSDPSYQWTNHNFEQAQLVVVGAFQQLTKSCETLKDFIEDMTTH